MAKLTNSFEGGTNGNTVTTAGSGGASGSALDAVVIGTAGTIIWDNTHAAHGTLGMKVSTGASGTATYAEWNTSEGTTTTIYLRAYIYFTANPGAQFNFIRLQNGGATVGQIRLRTDGKLELIDSGGTARGTTTNAIGLNQWVRVEVQFVASATVGSIQLKLFNSPDSTTPTETLNSTASINTGTQITKYQFGITVNSANISAFWFDDIGIDSAGYLGPSSQTVTISPALATATAQGLVPTLTVQVLPALATATAAGLVPTVKVDVSPAMATATAAGIVPTLTVAVLPPLATATAQGLTPNPTAAVLAPLATATALALTPTLSVAVSPAVATAAAQGLLPTLTVSIFPPVATATAQALVPTLTIFTVVRVQVVVSDRAAMSIRTESRGAATMMLADLGVDVRLSTRGAMTVYLTDRAQDLELADMEV